MIKRVVVFFVVIASFSFGQFLGPKASIKKTEHDFKNIVEGKIVDHNFTITNLGGDLLKITGVRASCGCTAANPDKSELKPGESTSIKVSFNSSGRSGPQTKFVYVSTNDPANNEIKLKITGNVVTSENSTLSGNLPKIYFPIAEYDFGKVKEGSVVSHTFKFENKGKATLDIADIKTSCGCTAALVSSKQIAPGKNGTIKVDLDTKNRQGRMSRTITISSNDPEQPNKVITIFADISRADK